MRTRRTGSGSTPRSRARRRRARAPRGAGRSSPAPMSSTFGQLFRITTFGESHGPAVGVVVDGMPPGVAVEPGDVQRELDRRRPGQSALTTQRQEADQAEIL